MQRQSRQRKRRAVSLFLLGMFIASMLYTVIPRTAYATAPISIAPDVGVNPGDYQFQLTDYSNSYVKFGINFYADQILMYGDKMYFTNIALGSASNPTNNFGLGIQSGNATINAIGTNIVTTGITCTVATFCYPFYYYNLGQTLSRISVTQGSTTTAIPVSSFTTDFSAFSVMAAPAVFWDPTKRYYEVKVYYTGTTSISFESNTGGTGINPVSFESTATVYSVASDPDFQRVYQDTVNNKALFFDAEPTNGTYFESSYDIASGISTNTATGIANGGNTVNSATYFSPVELNEYVWAVGRDSTTGNNVYALRSTSALAAVNATSQSSTLRPLDIAQSTTKLYSPLGDSSTQYGTLYMAQQTRAYGSYSETSILTGSSGAPIFATVADQSTGTAFTTVGGGAFSPSVAEKFTATAAMHGKEFTSMSLSLSKFGSPTGNATIGTLDASNNIVQSFGTIDVSTLTGSQATYYFALAKPYVIQTNDRIGIKYTGGDASNYIQVYQQNADVYDGTNAVYSVYGAGPWSDDNSKDLRFTLRLADAKTVVYDGSPDTTYTFFESGTGAIKVIKYNGSATLLAGSMTHTVGQSWSVIQLTDKMIVQTANDTYVLPRATDTISLLYPNTFNTRYSQTFLLSPGGRTYSSNPVYIANSTYAINFTPSLGTGAQTGVIIDSVDDATGTMNVYAPAKYYYLTAQSLTVESLTLAGTTWTISQLSSMVQIAPTIYTERLGIDLVENTTAIVNEDVIRLVCNAAEYHFDVVKVAISDDSGCTGWKVLDQPGNTIGRTLLYSRTPELVYASSYANYNINVSMAVGTGPDYYARIFYDNKIVDNSQFDDGNNAQLRMLYGQCYTLEYIKILDGSVAQSSRICADDVIFKQSVLITDLGFPFWSATWGVASTYANSILTVILHHNTTPYSYDVYVRNGTSATLIAEHYSNVGDDPNVTTYNMTSYLGQEPFKVQVFRNDTGFQVYSKYFGQYGSYLTGLQAQINNSFGTFEGWSILMFLPLIFAAMFTRNTAGIGGGMVVAFIGVLVFMGLVTLPDGAIWIITFVALIGLIAYRLYYG